MEDEDGESENKKTSRKELKRLIYEARNAGLRKDDFQLIGNRGYCVKYLKITPKTVPIISESASISQKSKKKKKNTTRGQLDIITDCIGEMKQHILKNDELKLMRLMNDKKLNIQNINQIKEITQAGLNVPNEWQNFVDIKREKLKRRRDRIASLPIKLILSNQKVYDLPPQKNMILAPMQTLKSPAKQLDYKSIVVVRDKQIEARRAKLPSIMMEQEIIHSVLHNHVTIVTGDTGCGKSTQIPQFLYENGFCYGNTIIGVTQPRRVACMAISNQVKSEIGDESLVGFHMRNLSSNAKKCKIKFMTEGILLQEVRNELLCSKYSVIIIDEAHERSLNCDILIGILSRVIFSRWKRFESNKSIPLKLVIMSATINVEHLVSSEIFKNLSVNHVHISSLKQPTIAIHYLKKTKEDYLAEAKKAVIKIHSKFPRGSILVFVCGKDEIKSLIKSLEHDSNIISESELSEQQSSSDESDEDFTTENADDSTEFWKGSDGSGKLKIVALHASQAPNEQNIAFMDPNDDERVVIISTNVAETSITLPNIRYVIDCGKEKRKSYTCGSGISKFVIGDISQSSADQRAGRAGRLGPGHCYRMYSSSVYNHIFKPFSQPEIEICPLDGTILFLSSLGITRLDTFPFLSAPSTDSIDCTVKRLVSLDALSVEGNKVIITNMGRVISEIPIEPRYARMILLAMAKQDSKILVWYTCLVASALSLGLLFNKFHEFMNYDNDIHQYLLICLQFYRIDVAKRYEWCGNNGVNYKSMAAIIDLATFLLDVCNNKFKDDLEKSAYILYPEDPNAEILGDIYEIVLNGLVDQIAMLESGVDNLYVTLGSNIPVKICGNSVCRDKKHGLVAYNSIIESQMCHLTGILPVDREMIARIDSSLVETRGEPQAIPRPSYVEEMDCVIGYVTRVYKPAELNLGVIRYPIRGDVACRCFGEALLSGKVYESVHNPHIYEDVVALLIKLKCFSKYHLEAIYKLKGDADADRLKDLLKL